MTWKEHLFWEAVYRHAVSEIQRDESKSAACKQYAHEVLGQVVRTTMGYRKDGIIFWLPLRILYKKCHMIEQADTKAALKEIATPSSPEGSYGKFREGPYHVAEEEMLFWSRLSFMAPLNQYGYRRYMELFSRFFPEEARDILGKNERIEEAQP